MASLKLWSQSGISSGDVAFIPTFGKSYADPAIASLNYKCGFLVKASANFTNAQTWNITTTKSTTKRNDLTLDTDTAGSGLFTAGGFNLVRFTVASGTNLNISGRLFAVKTGITYDLLYFGSSTTHYAYLIANDKLVQSEIITSTAATALTITGTYTLVGKWKATAKEYLICHDPRTSFDAGAANGVVKISRDGNTYVKAESRTLYTSTNGTSWTSVNTVPSTNITYIHQTAQGYWLVGNKTALYRFTANFGSYTTTTGIAPFNSEFYLYTWQNGITEDVTNGILWAAPYSLNGTVHKIYRSTDDGVSWTEQIDVETIFGANVRHCENILYNKYTDKLHIVVGESADDNGVETLGAITAVGDKNGTTAGDFERATVKPYQFYQCGGYYRGCVISNGQVLHGSDTPLNTSYGGDLYMSFDAIKGDGTWDLLLGKKMGGKWAKGFTQSYTTANGIALWCKGGISNYEIDTRQGYSILAVENTQPVLIFDSAQPAFETAISGNSDFQSNKFVLEGNTAVSGAYSALFTFDLDVPMETTKTSTVTYNTTVTAPDPAPVRDGYTFNGWYTDQAATQSFNFSTAITANTTLYAGWTPLATYTITASADLHYTIYPQDNVSVTSGDSVTFTITADSGYENYSVIVDGTNVGTVETYTFSNVTTNHTIHVKATPKTAGLFIRTHL